MRLSHIALLTSMLGASTAYAAGNETPERAAAAAPTITTGPVFAYGPVLQTPGPRQRYREGGNPGRKGGMRVPNRNYRPQDRSQTWPSWAPPSNWNPYWNPRYGSYDRRYQSWQPQYQTRSPSLQHPGARYFGSMELDNRPAGYPDMRARRPYWRPEWRY